MGLTRNNLLYNFFKDAQDKTMKGKKMLKFSEMVAFGLLLVGGLNFLLMGLFNWNMIGAIFGGTDSVTSRVFFSLFGIAAVTLLAIILWKAFMTKKPAAKSSATKSATTSSPSKAAS